MTLERLAATSLERVNPLGGCADVTAVRSAAAGSLQAAAERGASGWSTHVPTHAITMSCVGAAHTRSSTFAVKVSVVANTAFDSRSAPRKS